MPEEPATALLDAHKSTVRALRWIESSADEHECKLRLASAALDGALIVWDVNIGLDRPTILMKLDHQGNASSPSSPWTALTRVELPSDHQLGLAGSSADGSISVWKLVEAEPQAEVPMSLWIHVEQAHELGVCALTWLRPYQIASGSSDSTIKLWHLRFEDGHAVMRSTRTIHAHGPIHALALIPTHGWLASASLDGSIRLWRVRAVGAVDVESHEGELEPSKQSRASAMKRLSSTTHASQVFNRGLVQHPRVAHGSNSSPPLQGKRLPPSLRALSTTVRIMLSQ
eukprot:SAG11_NODE_10125_length_853_cov_0.958886_1_plen_284_part_11